MDFDEVEKKVAAYKGPKIAIIVTGGGQGIAQLATVPGASKVLHAIHIPYSYEESVKFIDEHLGVGTGEHYRKKAVSEKSATLLCLAGMVRWPDCRVIACTAATTTSRWRRGENQAFLWESRWDREAKGHHLKLSKLSEEDYKSAGGYISWKRRAEDREITEFILNLIFGEK